MPQNLDIVIFGLSITSSWGNGHATTYRHLVDGLCSRGHQVTFLERDVPWYADNRDLPQPPHGDLLLYQSLEEAFERFGKMIHQADAVIVGSYVPDGIELGRRVIQQTAGVAAFYDIDTPVTLASLESGACEYLTRELIPQYDLYLSFTGGPTLQRLEQHYGSPCARPLYCSVDPQHYYPETHTRSYDLGYMGTYSDDRQPGLESLLLQPARRWSEGRFIVAGPQYPSSIQWPENVDRSEHLPPDQHREFYNRQRFTLNITREAMRQVGYAPSIRLFEAAACGTAIISDHWPGLDELFEIGEEILVASSADETLRYLKDLDESVAAEMGRRAQQRVLAQHTGRHRAVELEQHIAAAATQPPSRRNRDAGSAVNP